MNRFVLLLHRSGGCPLVGAALLAASLSGGVALSASPPAVTHAPVLTNSLPARSNAADSAAEVLESLRDTDDRLHSTNLLSTVHEDGQTVLKGLQLQLETARQQHRMRLNQSAIANFVPILRAPQAVEAMKRVALLELGLIAQEEDDLPKAQQIFAQYLSRWPKDPSVPEVVLRQGLVYRQMGLNQTALAKFYAVMTSALVLKTTMFDYYQRLVLQAQTEIAETHYQIGQYQEAAEYLARLLKMDNPILNRPQLQYKLVRSLSDLGRYEDVVSQAVSFLAQHPAAPEQPEVRFLCANAYLRLGRNSDSLQQVLLLLQEQQTTAQDQPATWAYWQRRVGNEVANQLYREGDYAKALDIYMSLAEFDKSPSWQLPVWYQAGLAYERLEQSRKAVEIYGQILAREREAGTNLPPSLRAVLDMARWRQNVLNWQVQAEARTRETKSLLPSLVATNTTTAVRDPAPEGLAATSPDGPNRHRALPSDPAHPRMPDGTDRLPTPQLE